jgi:hypothetical protein
MQQRGERIIITDSPLFGRLIKGGKQYLLQNGWTAIEKETSCSTTTTTTTTTATPQNNNNHRLALIWPSKTGPQFEMDDLMAAHTRPYPRHITDVLDDKLRLFNLFRLYQNDNNVESILPTHISSPERASADCLYFVKHRCGAQGKSVYVYNKSDLHAWWNRSTNRQDFVIQQEVLPELYNGRKFVIRSHVLLYHRNQYTDLLSTNTKAPRVVTFESFLHKQIIVQHHSAPYDTSTTPHVQRKASYISQAGNKHPSPVFLHNLPNDHPAADMYPEIRRGSKLLISKFEKWFTEEWVYKHHCDISANTFIASDTTCFALLGVDWVVQSKSQDKDGKILTKLCEVNSHPALGWGTMSKVPSPFFDELIQEAISLMIDDPTNEINQI